MVAAASAGASASKATEEWREPKGKDGGDAEACRCCCCGGVLSERNASVSRGCCWVDDEGSVDPRAFGRFLLFADCGRGGRWRCCIVGVRFSRISEEYGSCGAGTGR